MMRFKTRDLAIIIMFAAAFLPGGCKRDKISPETSGPKCQIKKVIQKIPGMEQRTGVFTYNDAGDPVDFTPQGYSTGSVKYEFRYDKLGRLSDYIGYYPAITATGIFEFWRKFTYDDKGRITRDTAYHYGSYGSMPTNFSNYKVVTEYEYDREDRVSRKVWRQLFNNAPNGIVGDYKYVYNGQGNLVTPGAVYDDKISVYSLNKIWMFLNCNYSENNLLKGTSYNQHGLPLGFGRITQPTPILGLLGFLGFNDVEIQYECK